MNAEKSAAALGSATAAMLLATSLAMAQVPSNRKFGEEDKFRQLEEVLPTPNQFRTGSVAPTELIKLEHLNQRDYKIKATLDDDQQRIKGTETITYTNHSAEKLEYLWLQLDANMLEPDSDTVLTKTFVGDPTPQQLNDLLDRKNFRGGMKDHEDWGPPQVRVKPPYRREGDPVVVKTMLRLDLAEETPLLPGKTVAIEVDWSYRINDAKALPERSGYERFEDGNFLYEVAQRHPRMAAFLDTGGWQHKQFLGEGEFTLEFGSFNVELTVPSDHVVAATGTLRNPGDVLTGRQIELLETAKMARDPVFIVSPAEASDAQKRRKPGTRTWKFTAEKVRDFAFASSRKFIWDAKGVDVGRADGKPAMAMSFYPLEAEGKDHLWSTYSTRIIEHTLRQYASRTFPYPYESAISVNGPVFGMEYPMICFNGPRPNLSDGSYSKDIKEQLIGVVVHEVGHNWFPMIVNSDERQWTWMDEGLNSYLEYLTCQAWADPDIQGVKFRLKKGEFPPGRGNPRDRMLQLYMSSQQQVPIMTNADSLLKIGNNAYGKPATALVILRETIFGRNQEESRANFDHAFRVYANRWRFSRPMPADFFRSMEDASGIDLDWFWRGWFYTTDHVDLALDGFRTTEIDPVQLRRQFEEARLAPAGEASAPSRQRDQTPAADQAGQARKRDERPDPLDGRGQPASPRRPEEIQSLIKKLESWRASQRPSAEPGRLAVPRAGESADTNYYYTVVDVRNVGGLVMPVLLDVYERGSDKPSSYRIPAEIWRHDNARVRTVVFTSAPVVRVVLDPNGETADVDASNNVFPPATARLNSSAESAEKQPAPARDIGPHKERR